MDNNYLAHHGVLGMKWGVRRYQNADGTLTEKGMKRYRKNVERGTKRMKNRVDYVTRRTKKADVSAIYGIQKSANSDFQLRKRAQEALGNNDELEMIGRKTHTKKVLNWTSASIASGASATAVILAAEAMTPIAAIPVAAIVAGTAFVNGVLLNR